MQFSYKFPEMKEYTAPNGLKIILIPNRVQPVLTVALRICKGTLSDDAGYEGTAELLCGVVQKGGAGQKTEDFNEKFESRGAIISAMAKEEYVTYSMRTLVKFQEELAPLFKEMIVTPALEKKEFSIIKKELLTGFKAELSSPSVLSASHFNAELFGKDHPAGRIKSVKSLKSITYDKIKQYFNDYYSPKGSLLIISGDASFEEMERIWGNLFNDWESIGSSSVESTFKEVKKPEHTSIRLIDKPELTQTTIMLGHEIPGEINSDRLGIAIANYILGGGNFSSRLMKKVRTELGNTYGISSHVWASRYFGTFSVSTSTRNDSLKQVIQTILNSLNEIISEGITEEELTKARQYALGSMAFELEGLENVIEKLLWLRFTNRDNLYIENAAERLNELSLKKLNDILKKYFRTENIVISATGRKTEVEGILSEFGKVENYNFRKPVHL